MKKDSFKQRFNYWFDKRMAKGSTSMIKMLSIFTLIVVAIIAAVIYIFDLNEGEGLFAAFWDGLATIINSWMPYSSDGSIGYILLTALAAVAGLMVTSVLIGIISSAIEEKITDLRKGNSLILEENHIVVMGFNDGEYAMLNQLILAADDDRRVIVVAEEKERDEMEDAITSNIDIPDNVELLCRNVDCTDPVSLQCLSLENCRCVVINGMDNNHTIKTILAVNAILKENENSNVKIICSVSEDGYMLSEDILRERNVIMLQSNEIIARVISHSCSQPGLSSTFEDVFDYQGCEFYADPYKQIEGKSFEEVLLTTNHATPVGIVSEGKTYLNPASDMTVRENDELIYFAIDRDEIRFVAEKETADIKCQYREDESEEGQISIFGYNEVFDTIIRELPQNTDRVVLYNCPEKEAEEVNGIRDDIEVEISELNVEDIDILESICKQSEHVIVLNSHDDDEQTADVKNMLLIINLRNIKKKYDLDFSITCEMRTEANRNLISDYDSTDFIVASDITSMALAQMVESPELEDFFSEILTNVGNELYLKKVEKFDLEDRSVDIRTLRKLMKDNGYILLGYQKETEGNHVPVLNPDIDVVVHLEKGDSLVLIGDH